MKLQLLVIFIILLFSCKEKSTYKSKLLKRYDLKGNVKSVETNINFTNNLFDKCDEDNIGNILNSNFLFTKFSLNGLIEFEKENNMHLSYDKLGKLIRRSYKNNKGIEYGYTNILYYKNNYYKNTVCFDVDSSRNFKDTVFVIEKGTRNKFKIGMAADLEFGIEVKYVLDKDGFLLEKMFKTIEGGVEKFKYDKNKNLISKVYYYDNIFKNKSIYTYSESGLLKRCNNNLFYFKNFDDFGNWTELIIKNIRGKIIINRYIEYY